MESFLVPTEYSEVELVEKRSRFIGRLWAIESEEQARQFIQETSKQYHDARHTCWCFSLRDEGIERYSDDGEPQGTAGQPMLELFKKRGIQNYCCTVTRYFGGILLGTGGLMRAYTQTAAQAVEQSGVSLVGLWYIIETNCSYSIYEKVKLTVLACEGQIKDTNFGASVQLTVLLQEEQKEQFSEKIRDLSAGQAETKMNGTCYMAFPLKKRN